jgi:hypothetical protein
MQWKLFLTLTITFIAFTIIGTQTHEWGHYAAAKYMGMKPTLSYQSVDFGEDSTSEEMNEIQIQFEKEILAKANFPLRQRYEYLEKISDNKDFYCRLWGPLQTMITGSIGFILLIIYRKQYLGKERLSKTKWLLIFLSLFWLREVFNTFLASIIFIIKGRKEFYGDEFILSEQLNLPSFFIPIITALIGFIVCCIVTFKFVPYAQRKTFIAAGFFGGIIGFIFWMYFLGPLILP